MCTYAAISILATCSTALGILVPPPHLEYRASTSISYLTGQPLTLSYSLTPSPQQTGAAISSAYAAYSQACGSAFAQVVQDGLAEFNNLVNADGDPNITPITRLDDGEFQEYLISTDTAYQTANKQCTAMYAGLYDVTRSLDRTSGAQQSQASGGSLTRPATSSPSKGAAQKNGPVMLFVIAMWAFHRITLG
ncbi:hypothetical protein DFH06DRAFT_1145013 [Mycena polygramma]|nr:hypothetical protein DFH06DRAFT_1145013 [Mycena polygramma]